VAEAAERYRHGFLTAPGSADRAAPWPPPGAGADALDLRGANVALSSLRRREVGWLEARVVNLAAAPATAILDAAVTEAREATLRGEPGEPLPVADGALTLRLGPAEIRTVGFRRSETAELRPEVLDAGGPRQSG
jgi:alpha-mannosidase